ncbi:MAG: hypothetical protein HYX68_16680 [Planctomycetes bacterium]|nr:hypothetical protein [Planctomycetota bacterium]
MKPKPTTIADLISLEFKPEDRNRRKPVVTPLVTPLCLPETTKLPRKFECEVFNFLLANKDALGIETVFRFKNLFVDGAILLTDGRRLTVEVKLRMNWSKALQAESEFRRFLLTSEAKANPVNGMVVFFEEFQGDGWHRRAKSRLLENGWNHWYANYFRIEGYRADLFRLRKGVFEHYGLALANSLIANVEQMSEEEKKMMLEAAQALEKGDA